MCKGVKGTKGVISTEGVKCAKGTKGAKSGHKNNIVAPMCLVAHPGSVCHLNLHAVIELFKLTGPLTALQIVPQTGCQMGPWTGSALDGTSDSL